MSRDSLANLAQNLTIEGGGLIHRWRQDGSAGMVRELRRESRPDFRKSPWRVARHALRRFLFVERCSGRWPRPPSKHVNRRTLRYDTVVSFSSIHSVAFASESWGSGEVAQL